MSLPNLWSINPPTGTFRYYSGMLYTLGTLATSGNYQIYSPAAAPTGVSKLSNGDFTNGTANWLTSVDTSASATFGILDGAHVSYIANGGTLNYNVQVYQNIGTTLGKKYRLDFDAHITEGSSRGITAKLEKRVAPYT